jgi:hypothetical protein
VDRTVVVHERDEAVVFHLVLADAAVYHDDQVPGWVVRAALGVHDRAVDLHIVGHRSELTVHGDAERRSRSEGILGRGRSRDPDDGYHSERR